MTNAKPVIERDFQKALRALSKSGKLGKDAAIKGQAAITQVAMDGEIKLPRTHHGESRLDCEKYDLGQGYRLITQRISSNDETLIVMMFIGTHDDADRWLKRHRNYTWVRRESDGALDFISVALPDAPHQVPTPDLSLSTPEHVVDEPLLNAFSDEEFQAAGLGMEVIEYVRHQTKGDWGQDNNAIVNSVEKHWGTDTALLVCDLLVMADCGDTDGVRQRLQLAAANATIASTSEIVEAIDDPRNSETFFTWTEDADLPDPQDRADWMLYLHPEQKKIAVADINGASRLRGVSGSGKTCVLVHRARYLAKKYGEPILIVTLTESMRRLLESLVISLCGAERALIEVSTVASVAREVIRRFHPDGERWYTMADTIRNDALEAATNAGSKAAAQDDVSLQKMSHANLLHFLDEEISYVRSRLLPSEYGSYLEASFKRAGRKQALGEHGRRVALTAIRAYDEFLRKFARLDHEGIVQVAVELLQKLGGNSSIYRWRAALADEVQDLSQNEVRLLALLRTPDGEPLQTAANGLFFVGDGAQTIYKRGFSFQSLCIQLARSHVFKKNYRNTYEILRAAYGLIEDYEFADVDEDHRQKPLTPDFAVRRGDRPKLVKCRSMKDEIAFVCSVIEHEIELSGGENASDICVISRLPPIRQAITKALNARQIRCVDIKDNVGVDTHGIRISTVESSKGFEFQTVIVAGVSEVVGPLHNEIESDPSSDAAKFYVAMTRARESLFISYTSNAERKPADALSSIQPFCDEAEFIAGTLKPIRSDVTS